MKISLLREHLEDHYTIGKMYIDNKIFCDTLEDKVRIGQAKVYGQTAIPYGKYRVVLTMSNRFKKVMPLLLNVEGFEGIRIHAGNTDADTHGCILLGENTEKGKVLNSRKYAVALTEIIRLVIQRGEEVYIEIL
jgi:hypothetical protein